MPKILLESEEYQGRSSPHSSVEMLEIMTGALMKVCAEDSELLERKRHLEEYSTSEFLSHFRGFLYSTWQSSHTLFFKFSIISY